MTTTKTDNRSPTNSKTLLLDAEKLQEYQKFLDESDMSEVEKLEFIETMRSLVMEFIWLGFKIHPLQQIEDGCGEIAKTDESQPLLSPLMLESEGEELSYNFKDKAELEIDSQREGVTA